MRAQGGQLRDVFSLMPRARAMTPSASATNEGSPLSSASLIYAATDSLSSRYSAGSKGLDFCLLILFPSPAAGFPAQNKNGKDRILPVSWLCDGLERLDVLSLPALGSFDHVELDGLTFLQRAEAVALNRRVVDEDVLAVRPAQESEALGIVKPFHCSLFHISVFPYSFGCIAELKRD